MKPKVLSQKEFIVSHGLVIVALVLVSIGLGVAGGRLGVGGEVVLFIVAMWLFAAGVCAAFSAAFAKLASKK